MDRTSVRPVMLMTDLDWSDPLEWHSNTSVRPADSERLMHARSTTASPREQIIDAALTVVERGGVPALTIAALVKASGVSNGSIYHHFGSRDGVVVAVFLDSFERCIADLMAALDERPAEQVVRDLACRYLDWVAANPARARFVYAAATSGGVTASAQDTVERKHAIFMPIARWFAIRSARGELRPLPAWSLDAVVMGPAHECARRFLAAPDRFDLAAARDLASAAAWAIIRPDGPGNG